MKCCKNIAHEIGKKSFVSCEMQATNFYFHNDNVCSFCDRHNYVCGEKIDLNPFHVFNFTEEQLLNCPPNVLTFLEKEPLIRRKLSARTKKWAEKAVKKYLSFGEVL